MTYPTLVNSQITDAVTQNSVSVLAQAPAMAAGSMYQSASHSIGLMYENAVQTQRNNAISSQAAANQGVIQIYTAGTMASAAATAKISQATVPDQTLAILLALKALLKE
jgi:hypothetical protein